MKIRIHMPDDDIGLSILEDKIATAHANAIKVYIENLDMDYDCKLKLFNEIVKELAGQ